MKNQCLSIVASAVYYYHRIPRWFSHQISIISFYSWAEPNFVTVADPSSCAWCDTCICPSGGIPRRERWSQNKYWQGCISLDICLRPANAAYTECTATSSCKRIGSICQWKMITEKQHFFSSLFCWIVLVVKWLPFSEGYHSWILVRWIKPDGMSASDMGASE